MLNAAQELYAIWIGLLSEPKVNPSTHSLGTPPRRRFTRAQRFGLLWNEAGDCTLMRRARLFKGHRA